MSVEAVPQGSETKFTYYAEEELPAEERLRRFMEDLKAPGASCPKLVGELIRREIDLELE